MENMNNNSATKTPTMESMKKSILDAGGLFYQYRPCRRDASTIYDRVLHHALRNLHRTGVFVPKRLWILLNI